MVDLVALAAHSAVVLAAAAGGAMVLGPVLARRIGWGGPPSVHAFAGMHGLAREPVSGARVGTIGRHVVSVGEPALWGLALRVRLRVHRGFVEDRRWTPDEDAYRTGDAAFDRVAVPVDDVRHVGPGGRLQWTLTAHRGRLRLRDRELRLDLPYLPGTPDGIARALGDLLRLAEVLDAEAEPARLVQQVRSDPVPRMRRAALQVLIAGLEPCAVAAARAALSDPAPEVRLVAARFLEHVPGLTRICTDGTAPIDVRLAAGRCLLALPGPARAHAAKALARGVNVREGRLAVQLATYAGAEDVLRELLATWPDPWIRRTAVRGLAQIGTLPTIALLKRAAACLGPLDGLRGEIRRSVRAIQARLRAEPGRLAVLAVEGDRGALTEAPGPGSLSPARG